MNNILIIYPESFLCFEKLKRKVVNITRNLKCFEVKTIHDKRGLLVKLSKEMGFNLVLKFDVELDNISHAIIFNDDNIYDDVIEILKNRKIPTRVISLKLAKAINIKGTSFSKDSTDTYEYIGRGSKWGNPYSMYENGDDRDEVIRKFKYDFDYDKFLNIKKEDFLQLKGKKLGCFCKPQACHGDVIAEYLNSLDDGE